MVEAVANALSIPRAASTTPMTMILPGVVLRNHQYGWAGWVGAVDPSGSVDGCASSTVTCPTHPRSTACAAGLQLYKQSLRGRRWRRVRFFVSGSRAPARRRAALGSAHGTRSGEH